MRFNYPALTPAMIQRIRAASAAPIAEALSNNSTTAPAPDTGQLTQYPSSRLPGELSFTADLFRQLIESVYQVASLQQIPFTIGLAAVNLRPAERRSYLFVQNQSGANQIVLGIGKPPTTGTPADGIIIAANLGFYEPLKVPQDDIWVIASGAGTPGCLIFGTY